MPRIARIVEPDFPHHVTQRGSRRQQTFFTNNDYRIYLNLLGNNLARLDAEIWAYCLMPNHVHLIVVPHQKDHLAKLIGNTHHRYARLINSEHGWQGHLWQERFHSFVMDEYHLLAALRYVELNPVRAGLCSRATEWRWSSVHANLGASADEIITLEPMHSLINDWKSYLAEEPSKETSEILRKHSRTGRPAGDDAFIDKLEKLTNKRLRPRPRGPRKRVRV